MVTSPAASRVDADQARWRLLPLLVVPVFMAQFDLFVVNVALPVLQSDLDAGPAALELFVGCYAFTYAAGLITGGRLGDMYGHRRLFLIGMAAFGFASLLCGLATSPGQLIAARLAQGLTAAAMVPQVLALITAVFPVSVRPRALSWFGVTMGTGAVAGQVLGALIVSANVVGMSWRAIFLVNVPIAIGTVLVGRRRLPRAVPQPRPKLDPVGVLAISAGLALILVPLTLGHEQGWPLWAWLSLAAAGPTIAIALAWERTLLSRNGQPLLDVRLFRESAFDHGLAVNVAAFAGFFSFVFTLTLTLQDGMGLTTLQAGLTFGPLGLGFAAASIGGKRYITRYGSRVVTAGTVLAAAGLIVVAALLHLRGNRTTAWELVGPIIVIGMGNGLSIPAVTGAVLTEIRPSEAGAAAGVLATSQQFASALGVAGVGTAFFDALGGGTDAGAYVSALQWSTLCALALMTIAGIVSVRLPRPEHRRSD